MKRPNLVLIHDVPDPDRDTLGPEEVEVDLVVPAQGLQAVPGARNPLEFHPKVGQLRPSRMLLL